MADEVAPAVPAATPEVDCSEAELPVRGFYRSPQATYMVNGVGFVADEPLLGLMVEDLSTKTAVTAFCSTGVIIVDG